MYFADGFEVTEALATVDVLRRAKLPVTTVGIGSEEIQEFYGITVLPDVLETDLDFDDRQQLFYLVECPVQLIFENLYSFKAQLNMQLKTINLLAQFVQHLQF